MLFCRRKLLNSGDGGPSKKSHRGSYPDTLFRISEPEIKGGRNVAGTVVLDSWSTAGSRRDFRPRAFAVSANQESSPNGQPRSMLRWIAENCSSVCRKSEIGRNSIRRIFNAKAQRRKDAKKCHKTKASPSLPLRLCVFAPLR